MARLGDIVLYTQGSAQKCGAVFTLTVAAGTSAALALPGFDVEVAKGQRDVVVRFDGVSTAADAFRRGHQLAQQGLDMLSLLGRCDVAIQDAESEHSVWWLEREGVVVRHVSTSYLRLEVGPLVVATRDTDGSEIAPSRPQARYHIAFRYFRLAQTTDDLYDAYRNMYLAFEALLSFKYPKRRGEKEVEWLRRGLAGIQSTVGMHSLVAHSGGTDMVETVLSSIYKDARLPLFHAKEGEAFFPPQDSVDDRQIISVALTALTQIVLRLAEAWFDVRRVGGGVFFGWVYEATTRMLSECTLIATSQPGPCDTDERDLFHERFRSGVRFKTRLAPDLQRGNEPAIFGSIPGKALDSLGLVRRFEVIATDHPVMAQLLESPLMCSDAARVEVLMHVRAMNVNQPKSLFRQ
jgi:hypothetical protein